MFALREFPPNPYLIVYHVPFELTRAVVEGYAPGRVRSSPPVVADILNIAHVRGVQFFRYELWVRRAPDAAWQALTPAIEAALLQRLEIGEIRKFATDQRYITFAISPFNVPKPLVFEGVEAAASHPLARELFAIEGVAEVLFASGQVRIRKGAAFRCEELQPCIEAVLRGFRQ
jgi:Scaffold protein Nfu/NifU N terminal